MTHADLVSLAHTEHRGLVVSRIRKAGLGDELEDITQMVYEVLLRLEHIPPEPGKAINYAISQAISAWQWETERNGVPMDPSLIETA